MIGEFRWTIAIIADAYVTSSRMRHLLILPIHFEQHF
jgi:hypothetical protein